MNVRLAFFAVAAGAHLLLVAASAAHVQVAPPGTAGLVLDGYGALSGSDNTYSFFAPGVAPQFRVTFTLTDADGHSWEETPDVGATREANLRFDSMTGMFTYPKLRKGVAASWSAALFGKHPKAEHVEIAVEAQDMPTMESYRDGYRPEWEPVYWVAFSRGEASDARPTLAQNTNPQR